MSQNLHRQQYVCALKLHTLANKANIDLNPTAIIDTLLFKCKLNINHLGTFLAQLYVSFKIHLSQNR